MSFFLATSRLLDIHFGLPKNFSAMTMPLARFATGAVLTLLAHSNLQRKITPIAHLDSKMIDEMSGIAKSRRYNDTYWVHNDSGDSARIFAIHKNGKLIQPHVPKYEGIKLEGSSNFDWEDIAIEGDTIYVSDCGDNLNFRKDLCVYMFKEPNPETTTSVKDVKKIRVAYPDKTDTSDWHYDCESLGVYKGTLYFITKWRAGRSKFPALGASIYCLKNPSFDKVNVLKKLDTLEDVGGWVTACDISADGKQIAMLTQFPNQAILIYDMTKGNNIFHHPLKRIKFYGAKQCEALCWDSPGSFVFGNEQSELFEIKR